MRLSKDDLGWAVSKQLISAEQASRLAKGLESRGVMAQLGMRSLLHYFIVFIIIVGLGWIMTEAAERFGISGIVLVSATYALWFVLADSWESPSDSWNNWQGEVRNETVDGPLHSRKSVVAYRGHRIRADS